MPTKKIILCADDYGQSEGISAGILKLLELKHLSATSCLTNFPCWSNAAKQLKPYSDQIDIGLHLNLTEGPALTAPSLSSLKTILIKSNLRLLNKKIIAAELNAQLDAFIAELGRAPDYLDGHQHIHHMPIIREVVLEIYHQRLKQTGAYIRSVINQQSRSLKKWIILASGALAFARLLQTQCIPHNHDFSGIYDLNSTANYRILFQQFIAQIKHRGLIMCHPGINTDTNKLLPFRSAEFKYFASPEFLQDCEKANVQLSRFKDL